MKWGHDRGLGPVIFRAVHEATRQVHVGVARDGEVPPLVEEAPLDRVYGLRLESHDVTR